MMLIEELQQVSNEAEFTTTDTATWLSYDYSTVQKWLCGGAAPLRSKHAHITGRLELLKKVLAGKVPKIVGYLPVPPTVTQYQRKDYIEGVLNHALDSVSKSNTSKRRV